MRDDDSNWFSKWEEELPSPEELMPLSQTLITPNLALAFNIPNPNQNPHHPPPPPPPPPAPHSAALSSQPNSSAEFDSGGADEPARTLKRPRLVWTPQLHKRFVDAVIHLGIKNAVPKTIMQLMSVDGLTRENVASHLQKYRLYLKRTQGISAAGASGQVASGVDSATDHLFASSLVPPHFLHSGPAPTSGGSDHFMPFIPMAAAIHHHQQQQQQMVGPPPAAHHQIQKPFQHFEHPFRRQQQPPQAQRIGPPVHGSNGVGSIGYSDDLEMANRRKVLTLFPTGND